VSGKGLQKGLSSLALLMCKSWLKGASLRTRPPTPKQTCVCHPVATRVPPDNTHQGSRALKQHHACVPWGTQNWFSLKLVVSVCTFSVSGNFLHHRPAATPTRQTLQELREQAVAAAVAAVGAAAVGAAAGGGSSSGASSDSSSERSVSEESRRMLRGRLMQTHCLSGKRDHKSKGYNSVVSARGRNKQRSVLLSASLLTIPSYLEMI